MTADSHSGHHKLYRNVGITLFVLTGITVAVSYLHMAIVAAIIVAVAIATFKGGLVARYFMHLKGENPLIGWILILTAFFFLFLILVPYIVTTGDYRITPP